MRITYHQIKLFLSVAETKNMRESAQQLFLSQPAITKQIKLLEETIENKLFHYDGKKTHLTTQGQKLLEYANNIDRAFENLHSFVKSDAGEKSQTISILMGASVEDGVLNAFKHLQKKQPKIKLNACVASHVTIQEQFYLNNADLMVTSKRLEDIQLIQKQVGSFKLLLCANAHNKNRLKESDCKLKDLPFVSVETKHESYHTFLQKLGIMKPAITLSQMPLVKSAILNGLGVGLLPDFLVKTEIKKKMIFTIPYKPASLGNFSVYVAQRKEGNGNALIDNFIEKLSQLFS